MIAKLLVLLVNNIQVMGQTLGTAAQWTSASKDGVGKLELTAANEVILNKIIAFIDGFPSRHSAEAKLTFKQPLVWMSELSAVDFSTGYTQTYDRLLSLSILHIHRVSEKSSTSYFAEYFHAGLADCKNFNGYRVRDNQ